MPGHSGAEFARAKAAPAGERIAAGSENLALLYQGLFTGIVRLQAKRQHISDGEAFRRRTIATLQEVERVARSAGYDGRDVRDTHFAVVAFLDSVVLHSNDAIRTEWERRTLQQELFGVTDAGEIFFEKLEQFRQRGDSEHLADILEVYLLCLLLGFEGKYSGRLRGELHSIKEAVAMRIDDIRGQHRRLSPAATLPDEPGPAIGVPDPQRSSRERLRVLALAIIVPPIVLFVFLKWAVNSGVDQLLTFLKGLL
jgi:type VI secretion system protein ImpK